MSRQALMKLPDRRHITSRDFLLSDLGVLVSLALIGVVLHTLTNGQYGFHRDELDTLDNARYLAWGYVAYPPLTPFIGRIGVELFGPSLIGIRFFAALSQGAVILLAGLMARELGGSRKAQVVSALAVATAPMALTSGILLHYLSFDYLWWVLTSTCMIYLLKTDNPRWWLGIGLGIGLGMMTKYTMVFFAAGIVASALLTRARRYLVNPWLWAGVGVSLLIFLPNLIWQVQHNFISLEFLSSIHQRDIQWGRTSNYLIEQLTQSANLFTIPLWIAGLYFYFIAKAGRPFRAMGWMFVIPFLLFWLMRGRAYYVAPAYPLLIAGGCVWGESWLNAHPMRLRRILQVVGGSIFVIGSGLIITLSLPIAPVNSPVWKTMNNMTDIFREMIGWPELVETVASVYHNLPSDELPRTAILTGNYGETGAINLFGPDYDLPAAISGADSAWYRGYGDPPPETVIVVGSTRDPFRNFFQSCTNATRVTNPYGVCNEESSYTSIMVCRGVRQPWPAIWEDLQSFQ